MPRIKEYKQKYMEQDIGSWVIGQMYRKGIKQNVMAKEMGISQQALSRRLLNNSLEYRHLLTIFKVLDADEEQIIKLMKVR